MEDSAAVLSLRERKKARTHEALIDTALRLFAQRGFATTTTEEIAAACEVSQRTFFRYFNSKEDVVTAVEDTVDDDFLQRFRERPVEEHPLVSLRTAALATWGSLDEAVSRRQTLAARLCEENPALLAAQLRRRDERQAMIVDEIVRRSGRSSREVVLRAWLAVGAFTTAIRVAHGMLCGRAGPAPADLCEAIELTLDLLPSSLTTEWHLPGSAD
ncbi:AcrR family transcriptional regulator [Actinoalloteichus hoggarensis]|uniref:Putative DNA-binding transcriptional regulator n=1 Tax=Actinoalloteichus hoggarensis TaxID=1470176 RepID=A0A221W7G4_9PSEU|nr:TetR family transcriptional regulator [Actinoalloteichus hoggarensis]ASO21815.1 putative DNA-binding transcriptional regulator [Actinoalloteichus hoggarensis]MBB5922413.1 AcrR family transcriptional regulator [Actinoalloteichus hoggarensis]